jgi:tetrahydromethanopterin S-methyltransferase subunit E
MPKKQNTKMDKPEKQLTPITVYISAFALGVIGYLVGEFILGSQPHPLHWLAGISGVVVGYFLGWRVYRNRGDIFGF